jgi:hypothetical protein
MFHATIKDHKKYIYPSYDEVSVKFRLYFTVSCIRRFVIRDDFGLITLLVTKLLLACQHVWNPSWYHCLAFSVLVSTTVLPPCIKCVCNWLVLFHSCLSILNFHHEHVNPVFIYSLYVFKQMRCKVITNNNDIRMLHFCLIPDRTIHVTFIVAPCILKIHWVLRTNKCTNSISYISRKLFTLKQFHCSYMFRQHIAYHHQGARIVPS